MPPHIAELFLVVRWSLHWKSWVGQKGSLLNKASDFKAENFFPTVLWPCAIFFVSRNDCHSFLSLEIASCTITCSTWNVNFETSHFKSGDPLVREIYCKTFRTSPHCCWVFQISEHTAATLQLGRRQTLWGIFCWGDSNRKVGCFFVLSNCFVGSSLAKSTLIFHFCWGLFWRIFETKSAIPRRLPIYHTNLAEKGDNLRVHLQRSD